MDTDTAIELVKEIEASLLSQNKLEHAQAISQAIAALDERLDREQGGD